MIKYKNYILNNPGISVMEFLKVGVLLSSNIGLTAK